MVMIMNLRRTIALALLAAPLLSPMAMAEPLATNAKHLYIVDYQTGSVLYDKLGNERLAPAS
jgi:D-alanyl-D-alanine carboxypeptidase